jgi:hypothetical protein
MQRNYSDEATKMHYELLKKVNPELPDAVLFTLLDASLSELTRSDCMLRALGRALCSLKKITDAECREFTAEKHEKAVDIIYKVDPDLLKILNLNIIDMLVNHDYSAYDIAIHIILDTLLLLGYITTDEFDKAYNSGGAK